MDLYYFLQLVLGHTYIFMHFKKLRISSINVPLVVLYSYVHLKEFKEKFQ